MITGRTTQERRVQRLKDVLAKARRVDGPALLAQARELRQQLDAAFSLQRFAALAALDTDNPIAGTESAIFLPIQQAQRTAYLLGQSRSIERLEKSAKGMETKSTLESRYRTLATQYLSKEGSKRIQGINDHTRKRLKEIVEQTEREKVAAKLYEQGEHGIFSTFRAQMIAQTEAIKAYESGKLDAAKLLGSRLGLKQQKAWQTSSGSPCPLCVSAQNEGYIDIERSFSIGADSPPLHPRCQCSLTYKLSAE